MLIDGVAGEKFDQIYGTDGGNYYGAGSGLANPGQFPVAFSPDGTRYAYAARLGNALPMVIGKRDGSLLRRHRPRAVRWRRPGPIPWWPTGNSTSGITAPCGVTRCGRITRRSAAAVRLGGTLRRDVGCRFGAMRRPWESVGFLNTRPAGYRKR